MRRCVACGHESDFPGEIARFRGERNGLLDILLCRDGIACTRRAMAREGVKLLPHPKNPPDRTADRGAR